MENVIRIIVFLLTELGAELSNRCSGIRFSRVVTESLFRDVNNSSTKQCDDPESNKATNGRACSAMAADVRESRKEFGEREVEWSRRDDTVLSFVRQSVKGTGLNGLPSHFPNWFRLVLLVLLRGAVLGMAIPLLLLGTIIGDLSSGGCSFHR